MGVKQINDITATQTTANNTDNFILQQADDATKKMAWSAILAQLQLAITNPTGTVIESAALTAPTGYLSCDGSAVSRTTYSTLYDAITVSKGTVTITSANPGVVTLSGHGFSTGSCIELTTTGTLPTNLSANTNYYVIYVNTTTFRLATSAANAIAGTAINTSGGSPSGTHTLRHCPFGISGSSDFLLPNRSAVVGVGAGSQTINTRAKTAVLGLVEEDQLENHVHTITEYDQTNSGNTSYLYTESGNVQQTLYTKSISSGRTGTTTHDNRIGMNYYIKY